MTDNIEQIRKLLLFEENSKDFYFLQIMKRRKDNPDLDKDMVIIKNYYIESSEQLHKFIPRIIDTCNFENARAYIRLNKRNYNKLGLQMIKRVADYIASGNERALKNVFDSVAGEFHSDDNKTWVVDVDWKDFEGLTLTDHSKMVEGNIQLQNLISRIEELQIETGRESMCEMIPTKNGFHIITHPFNLQKFKLDYWFIDVHKDNPTILYCP
jgi:hypothetical protein